MSEQNHEEVVEQIKTITSMNGSDTSYRVGEKVISEITGFRIAKNFKEGKVEGYLLATAFDRENELLKLARQGEPFNLKIEQHSETGARRDRALMGMKINHADFVLNMDDFFEQERYAFEAEELVELPVAEQE